MTARPLRGSAESSACNFRRAATIAAGSQFNLGQRLGRYTSIWIVGLGVSQLRVTNLEVLPLLW
jgi:hypothetical protein